MKANRVGYVVNYIKTNVKRYELKLSKKYDEELISKLATVPNVNSYLKGLIQQDIKKGTN